MKREAGVGQGFLDHSGISVAHRVRGNGNTGGQGPFGSGQGRDSPGEPPPGIAERTWRFACQADRGACSAMSHV